MGKFILISKVVLKDMVLGDSIPEADYTEIKNGIVYSFEYQEGAKPKLAKVKKLPVTDK